ncbi:Dynamin central region family protein [Histomonas meleagridis]|uniref:Dynamin central region family protein n=1 Tax=Histomonas meleagridis TaxID=135588 RepID=UPI0035596B8F|nr:Dynamin central region family protein [Histomonas meleagridis]KAH0798643.1 Dynamin central region family protein [Histomonas meleagridis]
MQTLIPVLNKLQDVFARVGNDSINLPQIVVVGCQSCGKSSVLESLVQKDFLPRGSGIVTRRPLILQLNHTNTPEEYAYFLHLPDKKFTNFDLVRKEIEDETERVCHDKGVTDAPISLKVYSPNVLNLTLVDLPGLTKVATEGQSHDLPQLIRNMVLKYIKPENSIILAISPANSDIANSDSLLIAKEVDPQGDRTIGVLTKLDIMDKGTNARDILTNKVYPLKLGFIGVVNRSQQDINSKKPMSKVLEEEHRFFVTSNDYRDIADVNGYPYLASTLNQILMKHIKKHLPTVHNEINELLRRKKAELEGYGETFGDNVEEQQMLLYKMIEHYLSIYNSLLLGTSDELRATGIDGGYYLMSYLVNDFPAKLNTIPLPTTMKREDVANMIEANSGIQRALFFPEATFTRLTIEYIEKLRAPSIEAAEMVHHRLMELHEKVHLAELDRFPKAKALLSQSILDIAKETLEECTLFIKDFIDTQEAYINSEYPTFKEKTKAHLQTGSLQSNVELLLELSERYFLICRREVEDQIAKGIHRILIKQSTEYLRHELFKRLVLKPNLTEDPEVAARRKKCVELIKALKEASSILNEVRMTRV